MTATASDVNDPVSTEAPADRASRLRLGSMLVVMSILHVVVPKPFLKMIPSWLGAPKAWNLLAAAAEGASGVLLLAHDRGLNRKGAWLATATIIGVYPGNITMAVNAGPPTSPAAAAAWLRLPFQIPLVRWAYRHTQT